MGPTIQITKAKDQTNSPLIGYKRNDFSLSPGNGIRMLSVNSGNSFPYIPQGVANAPLFTRNVSVSAIRIRLGFEDSQTSLSKDTDNRDTKSAAAAHLCRLTALSVRRFLCLVGCPTSFCYRSYSSNGFMSYMVTWQMEIRLIQVDVFEVYEGFNLGKCVTHTKARNWPLGSLVNWF